MTTAQLIAAIEDLLDALSARQSAASGAGDFASAASLMTAIANLTNAVGVIGANDIVATLPPTSVGDDIKAAMGKIQQATKDISDEIKTINQDVDIASNVATMILQVVGGQIGAAGTTALHLGSIA